MKGTVAIFRATESKCSTEELKKLPYEIIMIKNSSNGDFHQKEFTPKLYAHSNKLDR